MKAVHSLMAFVLLLTIQTYAQRREIGSGGRGGTLPDNTHAERPSRSAQEHVTPALPPLPSPPPPDIPHHTPIVVPGGGGQCGGVQWAVEIVERSPRYTSDDEYEGEEIEHAVLYDCGRFPEKAGFDLSAGEVVPCDDDVADLIFDVKEERPIFVVRDDTDLREVDEDDNEETYSQNWSESHSVPLRPNRCYIVWTWDNQYYKLCITNVTDRRVGFEWKRIGGERIAANVGHRDGLRHREKHQKFSR